MSEEMHRDEWDTREREGNALKKIEEALADGVRRHGPPRKVDGLEPPPEAGNAAEEMRRRFGQAGEAEKQADVWRRWRFGL